MDGTSKMLKLADEIVEFLESHPAGCDVLMKSGACKVAAEAFAQESARQSVMAVILKGLQK